MPMGAAVTRTPVATAGHSAQLPTSATLGALGVVYGDIGTSPLYALKEAAKAATHGGPLTNEAVLGVVSLILWALILIISVKRGADARLEADGPARLFFMAGCSLVF